MNEHNPDWYANWKYEDFNKKIKSYAGRDPFPNLPVEEYKIKCRDWLIEYENDQAISRLRNSLKGDMTKIQDLFNRYGISANPNKLSPYECYSAIMYYEPPKYTNPGPRNAFIEPNANINDLNISQLRSLCQSNNIDTTNFLEKRDFLEALKSRGIGNSEPKREEPKREEPIRENITPEKVKQQSVEEEFNQWYEKLPAEIKDKANSKEEKTTAFLHAKKAQISYSYKRKNEPQNFSIKRFVLISNSLKGAAISMMMELSPGVRAVIERFLRRLSVQVLQTINEYSQETGKPRDENAIAAWQEDKWNETMGGKKRKSRRKKSKKRKSRRKSRRY